jgi:hypothetical protein
MLAGKWTYRSFRNDPRLVAGDAAAALALIFGEGVFDLEEAPDGRLSGALGLGTGYALSLAGEVESGADAQPMRFFLSGRGIEGTATQGWQYDYRGVVAPSWPGAVDPVPSLLGTVLRVKAHGPDSPAGVTASFVAVRQREDARPRPARAPTLMAGL